MYDPHTQAFDIKLPWFPSEFDKKFKTNGSIQLFTIWHVDPEKRRGNAGCRRGDDTCGWFVPPYTQDDLDKITKLAKDQYGQLFSKQKATQEGKDYEYVCYDQDCYGAVYWSWRAIKARDKKGWQHGKPLKDWELDKIYDLATNPVDNLQLSYRHVKDEESFLEFFILIWRVYLRANRPWYKHPRWHIWHWKIQCHPWQTLRRFLLTRCCKCGGRFKWGESGIIDQWDSKKPKFLCGEEGLYHDRCSGMELKESQ